MGPGVRVLNSFLPRWWGIRPSKNCPGGWSGLELTDTLFIYVLIKKNLYLKSYLFGLKIGINVLIWGGGGGALMCGVDYTRGVYAWSNTRVKENVSLSVERLKHGELIGREIWYFFVAMVLPKE